MALDLLVVVPAFNEQRFIEGCIASINQHLSKHAISFETIVVDNGSADRTAELAKQCGAHVVTIERASVSRARNVGASFKPSRFIAFIDADVIVTAAWGEAIFQLLSHPPIRPLLTGCQYAVRDDASWIEEHWFKNLKDKHLNGGNIIVTREGFDATGGFDETLKTGEDYDFCLRAQSAGVDYKIDSHFNAIHLGYPRELSGFIKRELWHGEGDFRSFTTFINSPVAILGITYAVGVIVILLLLITGCGGLAGSLITLFVIGNFALTFLRFRNCNLKSLLVNSVINFIYFMARAFSLYKAIANKKNKF